MKNDPTTTLLNFVLALLVIASVVCAYFAMTKTSQLRQLTVNATMANNNMMRMNALLNDVVNYNATAKSPELSKAIAMVPTKPVNPK